MYYADDLSEEYNHDENPMTNYEMSYLIGRYLSDYSSIEVEDKLTVIVCDEI